MVFSSLTFLLYFLPLVLILHFVRKDIRWRNGVLLVASLFFTHGASRSGSLPWWLLRR